MSKDPSFSVKTRRRLPKKRIGKYAKIDEKVLKALKDLRKKGLTVDGERLKKEALKAYNEEFNTFEKKKANPFSASNGWLDRFKKRNRIASRAATSVGQKIPPDAKIIALDFFEKIDKLRTDCEGNFVVWNMDQMPVYFDSPNNRTLDFQGNDTISIKTTGHEKSRFTLMLCADNQGRKLKPSIIFKGIKNVPKSCIGLKGIHVMAGMSSEIMYLRVEFFNFSI